MNFLTFFGSVTVSFCLAACGGGGGGGSGSVPSGGGTPATPNSYKTAAAWSGFLATAGTWAVSGVASDGKVYDLSLRLEPAGTAIFPVVGNSANVTRIHNVTTQQGGATQTFVNEQFFDAENRIIGTRLTDQQGLTVCSRTAAGVAAVPPDFATVGGSGAMYASDTLTSCDTAATALGRSYTTWSVLEASGITYFCATTGNAPLNQPSTRYSETCIEIDANGVLQSRARIHIVQPGLDLIATN